MPPTIELCIIENGVVPPRLQSRFASYPQMIIDWLGPELPQAQFTTVSPVNGQSLPPAQAYDGYLLTGSPHSVYEYSDWMLAEIELLREARDLGRPIFGICFGHQLMADAFGGQTRKAPQGWGLGAQHYQYNTPALSDGASFIFHQDQVLDLPPEARTVGGSSHCPNGVLEYAFAARSVQYHPEFPLDYVRTLLELYGGNELPADRSAAALASLDAQAVDNCRVAQWAAEFFRQHAPRR